jgi:myo-inositol-1(or 4)-monophosphatase
LLASDDVFSLEADLELLKDAAREAARIARRAYEEGFAAWDKPGGSPVTDADLAVDRFLAERLHAARPTYGWLSEETLDDPARLDAQHVFIIDPIDGTRAFVKRRPNWTISLAIAEGGRPRVGVVIAPMLDELFEAVAGGGARLNGAGIRVSHRSELAGAKLLGPAEAFEGAPAGEPWPAIERDTFSSLAYRLCLVACGARDGALSPGSFHEWDIAAGDLILTEAGGRIAHLDGEGPRYNKAQPTGRGLAAAGPALFAGLLERLQSRSI